MSPGFENVLRGDGVAVSIGSRGPRRAFWVQALAAWFDAPGTGEAAFVAPGLPYAWRRADPAFRAFCHTFDEDADARVVETVRLRALGGDSRALPSPSAPRGAWPGRLTSPRSRARRNRIPPTWPRP